MFFGLSTRQFIFSLLACAAAVGIYFWCKPYFGTETLSWLCMLGAAPFAALGFVTYGVLRFTGERIFIRFGASGFESFPQFGGNISESRAFANEKNADAKLTAGQVAAMENGVIYGWDTSLAVPGNYDKEGHFMMPEDNKGGKRK